MNKIAWKSFPHQMVSNVLGGMVGNAAFQQTIIDKIMSETLEKHAQVEKLINNIASKTKVLREGHNRAQNTPVYSLQPSCPTPIYCEHHRSNANKKIGKQN